MKVTWILALLICAPLASAEPLAMVACAPGFPGSTEDAQPHMDDFVAAAAPAAGWSKGSLTAVYTNVEEEGVRLLGEGGGALALVPLPFWLKHAETLGLRPVAQVEHETGAAQIWSLAAVKGKVSSPASLEGWEVAALTGYAPRFVTGPVLGAWGGLPDGAKIVFTSRILGALRRAAQGEKVAAIVDEQQAEAIPVLPFGAELEVVHRSEPLPAHLLCVVGERVDESRTEALVKGLMSLHETEDGATVLGSMQLVRFLEVDAEGLEKARLQYGGSPE